MDLGAYISIRLLLGLFLYPFFSISKQNDLEQSLSFAKRDLDKSEKRNDELSLEIEYLKNKATEQNKELSEKEKRITELSISLENYSKIDNIINEQSQTYPWLAKFYAEYLYTYDEKIADYLNTKSRPAPVAAENVQRISREKKELTIQIKMLEHQLTIYESLFPWLLEFKELSVQDAVEEAKISTYSEDEYTNLRRWLSPEEYKKLPSSQKYQLALDRYNSRSKSKWQIGIDYERYIGYLYEQKGYQVKYNGALSGLEDMGRDLIASHGKYIIVIQCKRWAQEKTIHEKHIFQLFGSMVLAEIENPGKIVRGLFVTTTSLSSTALQCAKHLGIEVVQNKPLGEYPQIKCNISNIGEKIYHLPFDQQYDRIMLNPKDGDCYAFTVAEAEQKGFRRARRWHGTN